MPVKHGASTRSRLTSPSAFGGRPPLSCCRHPPVGYACANPPARLRLTLTRLSNPIQITPFTPATPPARLGHQLSRGRPGWWCHLGACQKRTSPGPVAMSRELWVGPSTTGSGGSWTTVFPGKGQEGPGHQHLQGHPWARVSGSRLRCDRHTTRPIRWGPVLRKFISVTVRKSKSQKAKSSTQETVSMT